MSNSIRRLFQKSRPCFHCSKSLRRLPKAQGRKYVGFILEIDSYERVFHQSCIDDFLQDFSPYTDDDDYVAYPERIARLRSDKEGKSFI